MNPVEIIEKKRDGNELSLDELTYFVEGFTSGDIPDYQVSAWAMAVVLKGMTPQETYNLTQVMVNSGDRIDLTDIVKIAVDKHSTGGVGDKTTLMVEPIVSACGVPVGKMSGRGLSFTGGTLDKMESIPGLSVELTTDQFMDQLREIGLVLSGQTANLAPADGKLYALRDVTGTVPSIPLIASSIMSKKLAAGAQAIVLDVKVGVGAFMPDVDSATELANRMVDIGSRAGKQVIALISDMNQPLGSAVGNSIEVREAIDVLNGGGPSDFREHGLTVAAHLLFLAGEGSDLEALKDRAARSISDGSAMAKFKQLVEKQGGDVRVVDQPENLPVAPVIDDIHCEDEGYIHQIHAREVGLTVVGLGGGRVKKSDGVDHAVGVEVFGNVGDKVQPGTPLFKVHARDKDAFIRARQRLLQAVKIEETSVGPLPLFYATIGLE